MLNREQAFRLIDVVLEQAGGHDMRVLINSQAEGLTRYANSEIHQNVFEDATSVTITVTEENKRSRIETTVYNEDELRAAADEAVENLQYIPEGEPQPPLSQEPALIDQDDFSSELAEQFNVKQRAILVKECLETLEPDYSAYGKLTYQENQLAFGNTAGVKRFCRANQASFTALIELDGEGGGTGFATTVSSRPDELDVTAAFKRAFRKAELNRDRREVELGPQTVILEPLAVSDLLTYMAFVGFNGKGVQNKSSFLTDKLGEQVFDERITIVDDHENEHTMSLPFDFEGFPRQKVTLVEDGVARGLVYDALNAQKEGVEPTGHSVDMPQRGGIPLHLVMAGGDKTLDELIEETDDALLITRFHYMNVVNPRRALLTGLTRDGVFKVEDGKLAYAVKNLRFTDSMLRAFSSVLELSSDREPTPFFVGNYYVPAAKLADFRFTGRTEA